MNGSPNYITDELLCLGVDGIAEPLVLQINRTLNFRKVTEKRFCFPCRYGHILPLGQR